MKMTNEMVMGALLKGATSLSEVYHIAGGKGNVSGSTTKKLREMIPSLPSMLADNKAGKGIDKGGTIASTMKELCPELYAKHFTYSKVKVSKGDSPKAPKAPSLKGKDRIVMTYQKTGNPFKVGSMKHVFFTYASKSFKPFDEIKDEVANAPEFVALCGVGMSFEDRCKRVGWQRDMIKASHANSKGATDIIYDETHKMIKAVCLA